MIESKIASPANSLEEYFCKKAYSGAKRMGKHGKLLH